MFKWFVSALGRMEELVTEMKNDVNKLPAELVKLPCVTKQLNLSAYNILSKLANQKSSSNSKSEHYKTLTSTTAIVKVSTTSSSTSHTTTSTNANSSSNSSSSHKSSNTSVIQQTLNKYISSTKSNKSSNAQPSTTVHSYALQTAGGSLLLYNAGGTQNAATQYIVSGNAGSTQQFALAPSTGGSSSSGRATQYLQAADGSLYAITTRPSQGQNIVLPTSQGGVIYWPIQQGTTTTTTQATAIIQQSQQQYATTATMPGSAVIAKENSKGKLVPTAITVATPVTSTATTKTIVVPSTTAATQVSVITID